ncbi:hypothetical protein ACWOB3_07720 [Enterococcus songbeiensis]
MATAKKEVSGVQTFKIIEGRNFNGFMHPATRKFVTEKNGMIKVDATDKEAIEILKSAADVTDITSALK